MQTSLAYIDDTLDRAIGAEFETPNILKADREAAERGARKVIGGFRVRDDAAERKAIDDIIAKRRAAIERFREDRNAVRKQLGDLGVTPLAVCPSKAWVSICKDAGLFILSPDSQGQVFFVREAFKDFKEVKSSGWIGRKSEAEKSANWRETLLRMFPTQESHVPDESWRCYTSYSHAPATLILPDPPEDVAAILCKVQSLTLKVAAVAEAISFAEKPAELAKTANANPKDLWAQAQGYEDYADWVKRDPIIYTEHGTATGIIAQFGDFPIEKQIVDAVAAGGDLIGEKPKAMERISPSDPAEMYRRMVEKQMYQQLRQQAHPFRLF